MGLFQTSVLKKYRKLQDRQAVVKAYKKYSDYFHNPERQENIRESKEEQFQEGFLRELFVKVLDYTLNPEPQFNLTTELKNEKGAKKADGAILKDGKALAVIELKSTKTKDLESIREQAFGYKVNHSECVYVITSNFEKLRFYINNAVDFEEFNLFTLNEEQFELMFLCLHKENILNNLPLKIKTDSVVAEESITKKFYSDYSQFKRELFRDLVKQNLENEIFRIELQEEDKDRAAKNIKQALFKKSQKLIDRFLFIFFAEDKGLLPPNSTLQILNKWKADWDFGDERPLYDLFKQYFKFLDIGRKGTQSRAEIFAYNGGLFKPDPILDSLILDNQTLFKHTKTLSDYDFESQVGVNILGHIFENSLNEIESVNAEIEGTDFDKQKTKRKKDGVFYTPKYITKYIVNNTVGKLCKEKKQELEINEEEYQKSRKGRKTDTLKKLKVKLDNYRNWLLTLTILDPACGSGAFLNQALDFLIKEHTYIDELETSLLGGGMVMKNIENTILENNIYGVDINEESVEIAKLSLWLRTAQPRRKLNTLNNNIKCGNSLIDDPKVAGDKAFNWQNEFPQIFKNGGFDVVIGNPPYVNLYNMNSADREFFEKSSKYNTTYLKYDIYVLFVEKGLMIVKTKGLLSYIIPSVVLSIPYAKLLREMIIKQYQLDRIVDFTGFMVFSDAMVESCIIGIKKQISNKDKDIIIQKPNKVIFDFSENTSYINQKVFENTDGFQLRIELDNKSLKVIDKIKKRSVSLESIYYVSKGIVAFSKIDNRNKCDFLNTKKINDRCKKYLEGRDVSRYLIKHTEKYLEYDMEIMSRPTFPELHEHPKILVRAISGGLNATFDYDGYYIDQKLIICSNRELIEPFISSAKRPKTPLLNNASSIDYYSTLGILNSKLSSFYYSKMLKGGVSVLPEDVRQFPVFPQSEKRIVIRELVEKILQNNEEVYKINNTFIKYLQSQFNIEKLSRKLQNWHELEFADFIKELNKAIKKAGSEKLTKKDEMEWMELFEEKKAEAQTLKTKIEKTDEEIDKMVYELYGLTGDEIKIVEET